MSCEQKIHAKMQKNNNLIESTNLNDYLRDNLQFKKLLKWAIPGLFLIYFRLFKHTLQFLQQINVKYLHPLYGAGN